jgi:hypothetical protein
LDWGTSRPLKELRECARFAEEGAKTAAAVKVAKHQPALRRTTPTDRKPDHHAGPDEAA